MKFSRAAALILFSIAGCKDFGDPNLPPFIEPGVGIDGIRIGDPRAKVGEILGTPDGGGIWDGIASAGVVDMWEKGPHAGLQVYYNDYFQGTAPVLGPADYIAVVAPYAGTTREGIGIGSGMGALFHAYASPLYTSIDSTGRGIIVYCNAGRYTFYQLTNSIVSSIGTGYNDPPPPGTYPFSCH